MNNNNFTRPKLASHTWIILGILSALVIPWPVVAFGAVTYVLVPGVTGYATFWIISFAFGYPVLALVGGISVYLLDRRQIFAAGVAIGWIVIAVIVTWGILALCNAIQ